jgi:SPASM domain peptide maturase of grasp-with-spasm system
MNLNGYIRFYECCRPVKGIKRAAIYDLQRAQIVFAPNELIDFIYINEDKTVETILEENHFQVDLLKKQLLYLEENELVFFPTNPGNFPKIKEIIDKPNLLEFIYLNIDTINDQKLDFLDTIDQTGANNLVLISSKSIKKIGLEKVLSRLVTSKIKCINIIGKYHKNDFEEIKEILDFNSRIRRCVFFDCNDKIDDFEHIKFSKKVLKELFNNGIISNINFTINLESFLESKTFNLFYNQKIFIGDEGNILKYFDDKNTIGNVYKDDLIQIIKEDKSLKAFWETSKDQIEECKNCEFRYICPDNRIPLKTESKKIVHESGCIYNPETNQWG